MSTSVLTLDRETAAKSLGLSVRTGDRRWQDVWKLIAAALAHDTDAQNMTPGFRLVGRKHLDQGTP